eukprot:2221303-Pleurochrysis_carterae.AAC.2
MAGTSVAVSGLNSNRVSKLVRMRRLLFEKARTTADEQTQSTLTRNKNKRVVTFNVPLLFPTSVRMS